VAADGVSKGVFGDRPGAVEGVAVGGSGEECGCAGDAAGHRIFASHPWLCQGWGTLIRAWFREKQVPRLRAFDASLRMTIHRGCGALIGERQVLRLRAFGAPLRMTIHRGCRVLGFTEAALA